MHEPALRLPTARPIINKTDLAPHVGANLDVMHSDTTRMRTNAQGLKPFVMTNLKTLAGGLWVSWRLDNRQDRADRGAAAPWITP